MVQFADIPQSGTFFKPAEYANAAAILIEPTQFKRQVPTNYGPKDEATATLSVFNSQADLDNGASVETDITPNSVNLGVSFSF